MGDAGATAAEDVRGANHRRQANLVHSRTGFVHRVSDSGPTRLKSDFGHCDLEVFAILCGGDRIGVGTDHLWLTRNTDQPALEQLHGDVETGLTAEGRQHGIGLFLVDDGRQHFPGERLDVGRICKVRVSHDRRRVGVGEDDAVTLFFQHSAGLRARVVKLTRLTNDDRPGADDEDRFDVVTPGHQILIFLAVAFSIMVANCLNR